MDVTRALQAAVFEHLKTNSAVSSIVGQRIFDGPPASRKWRKPYISFGPSYAVDEDTDCIEGRECTLQLDCWSRDQGRLGPCRDLADAVDRSLHKSELSGADPFAISAVRTVSNRVFRDPDVITAHGIVQIRATVETAN